MTVFEAATTRRTIRRFGQEPLGRKRLERYVEAARLAPSGANAQPLKYAIVDDPVRVAGVFAHVNWAGYIAPAANPREGERPTAFIAILIDREIKSPSYDLDVGAAAQNLMLAAWEDGVGSCWMSAIDRDGIRRVLGVPAGWDISTVVALGFKAEDPALVPDDSSVKYWKDEKGRLHVPKRPFREILVEL